MKQPKKLTREQKKLLTNMGMDARQYMMVAESNRILIIIHKGSRETKIIYKE